MKEKILPGHILTNKISLKIEGVADLSPTSVGALKDETTKVELPDSTAASGARRKATELTFKIPAHHKKEIAAIEAWRIAAASGLPGYKRLVTYTKESGDGKNKNVRALIGCWPQIREDMAGEMKGDGEMDEVEFTLSIDEVAPL